MKKKYIIILISALIFIILARILLISGLLYLAFSSSEIKINNDINKYNNYIGEKAKEEYQNKWGIDESIFPKKINNINEVEDYKMVYYNPWDAQYLSYLVVNYNDYEYQNEIERLQKYESTKYLGYYGVRGFDKYALLAMEADSYNGFVYAITDGNNKIIYVELIFCNYQFDFDYENYINKDYLPVGFNAKENNPYQIIHQKY